MGKIDINQLAGYTRITLTQDGKLGIGVLNPKSNLHVADEIRLGETSGNKVTLISDGFNKSGNSSKINLHIKTADVTVESGDIIISPGTANVTGAIELKKKVRMIDEVVDLRRDTSTISGWGEIWYITDTGLTTGEYTWTKKDYDRLITLEMGHQDSEGTTEFRVYLEYHENNGFYYMPVLLDLKADSAYTFIVPSGCRFQMVINTSDDFKTGFIIMERKFGLS